MRFLLRASAAAVAVCVALIFIVGTAKFLKRAWSHGNKMGADHVAVVDLRGMILSSTEFIKDLKDLTKDSSVKAIVVRINSPGGLVAPSQEMYQAIREADKKVPVLAAIGSLGASGGYYSALGAREIFADPGSFTVSIGVIMEFVNTERLYEWAKVQRFDIKSGKLKDAGSPFRPMTEAEHQFFQAIIDDVADQFKTTVKERRKVGDDIIAQYADGRVMTGRQALGVKLIDKLGSFEDALLEAKKLGKLKDDAPVSYPEPKGGLLKQVLVGDDEESKTFFDAISLFTNRLSAALPAPGWHVMLLAPIN